MVLPAKDVIVPGGHYFDQGRTLQKGVMHT